MTVKRYLITKEDVVDNLTSTYDDCPLSANQGRVLKGMIDNRGKILYGTTEPTPSMGSIGDIHIQIE